MSQPLSGGFGVPGGGQQSPIPPASGCRPLTPDNLGGGVSGANARASAQINHQILTSHFTLPLNTVAKKFGLCPTALKKLCRKFGIARWPHRKLKSLDKKIAALRAETRYTQGEECNTKHDAELKKLEQAKADLFAGKIMADEDCDDNSDDNETPSSPGPALRGSINFLTSSMESCGSGSCSISTASTVSQPEAAQELKPIPHHLERHTHVQSPQTPSSGCLPSAALQMPPFPMANMQQLNTILSRGSSLFSATAASSGTDVAGSANNMGHLPSEGWSTSGHCQLVVQAGDAPTVLNMCSAAGVQVLQVRMSPPPSRPSTSTLLALPAAQQLQHHGHIGLGGNSSPGVRPVPNSNWTPTLAAKDVLSSMLPPPVPGGMLVTDRQNQFFPFSSGPLVSLKRDEGMLSLHMSPGQHMAPPHRSSIDNLAGIKQSTTGAAEVH